MEKILQNIILACKKPLHEGFSTYSSTKDFIEFPEITNPCLCLVLEGKMQLSSVKEAKTKEYGAGECYIPTALTPKEIKIVEKPFRALFLEFNTDEIIEVMLKIEGKISPKDNDKNILSCILKLTEFQDENDFLFKHKKEELIFNLITGKDGKKFIENIVKFQNPDEIYKINSWIKENFKEDFSIEDLAQKTNMSTSSFHQKFKSAIGMGPLQCQKKLRLQEARRLMINKGLNVTDAALEVGYESVSQFIRDYKKMFGRPPQKDIQEIKGCIETQTKPG